jgi:hypothetical protein
MILLPEDACTPSVLHEIKELTRFLTELSVCDYFFAIKKATTVGLASLLTAMELHEGTSWKTGSIELFLRQVISVAGCDYESKDVLECKARLLETYIQGGFNDHQQAGSKDRNDGGGTSPVCVSNVPTSETGTN